MVKHYHHQYNLSYQTSFKRHFTLTIIVLAVLVVIFLLSFQHIFPTRTLLNFERFSLVDLVLAVLATSFRLLIAYGFALIIALPLALLATMSARAEKIFLPIFDILQSIPVLAFFPIIVLLFLKFGLYEGSAIFVLIITMVWSLVFSIVGGIKIIPEDVLAAAFVFGARGWKKLWFVVLPAIFPYLLTGSLLSWASGWNIIIVAEALHNYIPNSTPTADLFGLGSLLVNASLRGQNEAFLGGLVIMVLTIGTMNFFVWQKLLHKAEKFKFD